MAVCDTCFRHCKIEEGQRGFCGARGCRDGASVPLNYGLISSLALDPIEKKPLRRFHPGSRVLSAGSFGCNMLCPFCQNHEISRPDNAPGLENLCRQVTAQELADTALRYRDAGNIGLAFTYNEPLVGWEFVRDTARLVKEAGMLNVVVTNGSVSTRVLEELDPFIDAMNIDLKCFSPRVYSKTLNGDLDAVKEFITMAVKCCHVELTTLIVPGMNDSPEEMESLSGWVSQLKGADGETVGSEIPLHVTRFFPRAGMSWKAPTPVETVRSLAGVAGRRLKYVYTGNC